MVVPRTKFIQVVVLKITEPIKYGIPSECGLGTITLIGTGTITGTAAIPGCPPL